jgi:3-deoxy-manno-octulosonate cytidylyltransferase (CMP-KDO synthetase)
MVTRILGVIPARMGSSRFPGKPLAQLHGRPMVEHVYRRTAMCPLVDEVVIATCDEEIVQAAGGFGARAIMTSAAHERATDRVAEVSAHDNAEIVVMVQGDEPMVQPDMVAAAVEAMHSDSALSCVNLGAAIGSERELLDPNTIKVVTDRAGKALYFSRVPIPFRGGRPFSREGWWKQVCVIAFRRAALREFASMSQGPLEIAESVDMLRFLENGVPVQVVPTCAMTHAVDTREDLELVASLMADASATSRRVD